LKTGLLFCLFLSANILLQNQVKYSFSILKTFIVKKSLLILSIVLFNSLVYAQVPELVKNINTLDQGSNLGSDNASLGTNFFFSSGKQLWKTDGTPAGTIMIRDFSAEGAGSVGRFIATANTVYFMLPVTNAYQIWKTDGTFVGTVLVKDFGLGQPLFQRAVVANTVFFDVSQSGVGIELWKSDGTATGTVLVKDINPGAANSNPQNMNNINGELFFSATTSTGTGLWKSDGTDAGTVLITDLDAASNSFANSGEMTALGNKAVFYFESSTAGREIWISDGTAAGTFMLLDIYAGTSGSFPNNFTVLGNKLCFVAQDALNRQVWITDGTSIGTVALFDAVPNSKNDSYVYLTNCNGTLYFSVGTSIVSSTEPYTSNGTTAGTALLKDVNPGVNGSDSRGYKFFNGKTYFVANTPATGYELWSTDGSTANTSLFTEINPGTNNGVGGSTLIEAVVNNKLIFSGNHPDFGAEPYSSDGTVAGTQLLKNIQTQGLGSYPTHITPIGNRLYFSGTLGFSESEPWYSDGTTAGTQLLKDLEPGAFFSRPFEFTNIDNTNFYFRTFNSSSSRDIYKSDGTPAGTARIVTAIQPDKLQVANNILFFSKSDGPNGIELWKYQGTTASIVKNIKPGAQHSFPSSLTAFNNQLFFFADDGTNGNELWKSDGTDAGTQLVADINPGSASSAGFLPMVVYNNNLYMIALKNGAVSLMKTDGTTAGTTEVKAFTSNVSPGNLFLSGSSLYFIKKNINGSSQANVELWKTDGTAAGTVLVKEVLPYTSVDADYIKTISFYTHGSKFYFYVDVEDLFGETQQLLLWGSDGTSVGTVALKTYQFPSGQKPQIDDNLRYIASYDNNQVLFVFADAATGLEIWKTDGTAGGTLLVSDLNQGANGSNPSGLVNFNNAIYFSVAGPGDFNELWKINEGGVLPLKLISFTAYMQNKTVQLQWRTANEINSSHFEIQRSADSRNFKAIAFVNAEGRSANNYFTTDRLPLSGNNYYRLKIIDRDGTFTYSDLARINFEEKSSVIVQPNPAHDFIIIKNGDQYNRLRIMDISGKQMIQFEKRLDNRYNISHLSKGIYLIELFRNEGVETRKIIIE